MPRSNRAKRPLTGREVREQHAAALPGREAMSLLVPTTGALPPEMLPDTTATTDGAASYTGGAQDLAVDQTQSAQQSALESGASGQNAPNGTATSTATS